MFHSWLQASGAPFRVAACSNTLRGSLVVPERARDVVQDTFLRLQAARTRSGGARRWQRGGALVVHGLPPPGAGRLPQGTTHDLPRPGDRRSPTGRAAGAGRGNSSRKEAAGFCCGCSKNCRCGNKRFIQLKFQNGLSYQEISEITRLSVSNVGFLIHRGLKALREQHAQLAERIFRAPTGDCAPVAQAGIARPP